MSLGRVAIEGFRKQLILEGKQRRYLRGSEVGAIAKRRAPVHNCGALLTVGHRSDVSMIRSLCRGTIDGSMEIRRKQIDLEPKSRLL